MKASEYVQVTWAERVKAEYHSAAITAELLHWLIQTGVSPDTIETCHRIVQEELNHAALSRDVYLATGGSKEQIHIPFQELAYQKEKYAPVPLRALAMCADVFCCGETVAVPLFKALMEYSDSEITDPVLEQILADEAGHQFFGWQLLDELLELLGEEARKWLTIRLEGYIEALQHAYNSMETHCNNEDQIWGLMPGIRYKSICEQCITENVRPRFHTRGLLTRG